jgi:PEP-CTERM motif
MLPGATMSIKRHFLIAAGALLALSAAGQAQAQVFDFSTNNGLNTLPSPDTYSLTVGGITVNVSAYRNVFGTVTTSNAANVTWISGSGLGAEGYGRDQLNICQETCTGNPGEGLLLDFGQTVTLTQVLFGSWAAAIPESNQGSGDDADFAFGDPTASGSLADVTGLSVSNSIATWNTSLTGRQFFFAARQDPNDDEDRFWLRGLTVSSVPEPSSWAMMLIGFGAIGVAMRRSRKPHYRALRVTRR